LALSTRFILSRRTSSRPVDLPYRTHVVREVCNAGCQPPGLDIADQFLKAGGPVPAGAKTVGRWHTPGSTLGWHLIEAGDLTLVAEHVADWADLLEIDVYPVIEDAEAGAAAKKAFGK
jgi:hypothetical protein